MIDVHASMVNGFSSPPHRTAREIYVGMSSKHILVCVYMQVNS